MASEESKLFKLRTFIKELREENKVLCEENKVLGEENTAFQNENKELREEKKELLFLIRIGLSLGFGMFVGIQAGLFEG